MKYLTIDIGGTHIKYALMTDQADILDSGITTTLYDLDKFLQQILSIIKSYKHKIEGVAMSCPGTIDVSTGLVTHAGQLTFLNNTNLIDFVKDQTDLPATVMNDAKSAVLAELWKGNLKGVENGLLLTLGSGLGGGLIINGELYLGSSSQAGEVSFMMSDPSDFTMKNSIGSFASAVQFINQAADLLKLPNKNDGKTVFNAIKNDINTEVTQLFKDYCLRIAYLIHNIQMLLNMTHVVIGGGISKQPILIREINQQYHFLHQQNNIISSQFDEVVINHCAFHNDSNLIGALFYYLSIHNK